MPAETHKSAPLDRAEILALIQTNLAEILEKDAADIDPTASFESLGADSLALIEMVEALEEEIGERSVGFAFDDEDLEDLLTIADAVDYVAAKLNLN